MSPIQLGHIQNDETMFQLLEKTQIEISSEQRQKVETCRSYLEMKIDEGRPIYGVSTGFGVLANTWISKNQLDILQVNLIRSHAAALGDVVPKDITRTAMLLLINSLSKGHSGIRLETLDLLVQMVNADIIPITYKIGSLGASGDLATLAHVALVLIGEGEVHGENGPIPGVVALKQEGLQAVQLKAKEGLALINGTHFITAYALHLCKFVESIIEHNILGTALSLEATRGTVIAFSERIANLRQHPGHEKIAKKMREILKNSQIVESHRNMEVDHKVQDPYSFRTVPQLLGAVLDTLQYLKTSTMREINSVTDNPLIFPQDDLILSGGNFHAEPMAIPLEAMSMALVELGNITEKRINRLVHPSTPELPPFLASNPGVESGYMIVHYTVAALLNRARVLAHPAVTDNISVSGSQEDHVSFGMGSAVKAMEIAEIINQIVGLEILMAVRGLNMQKDRYKSSDIIESVISQVNKEVPFVEEEHYTREKMIGIIKMVKKKSLLNLIQWQ